MCGSSRAERDSFKFNDRFKSQNEYKSDAKKMPGMGVNERLAVTESFCLRMTARRVVGQFET